MDPYERYGQIFGGMVDRYLLPWMYNLSSTDHNPFEKVRDAGFAWATKVKQTAELNKERNGNRIRCSYTKEERQRFGVQRAINRALKDEAKRCSLLKMIQLRRRKKRKWRAEDDEEGGA